MPNDPASNPRLAPALARSNRRPGYSSARLKTPPAPTLTFDELPDFAQRALDGAATSTLTPRSEIEPADVPH